MRRSALAESSLWVWMLLVQPFGYAHGFHSSCAMFPIFRGTQPAITVAPIHEKSQEHRQPLDTSKDIVKLERKKWLRDRLQLNDVDLERVLRMNPDVLKRKSETLEEIVSWYEQNLGFNTTQIVQAATIGSRGFLSSTDNKKQKRQWLQESLNLSDAELSTIVRTCPQVLGYSDERKFENLVWLKKRFNLSSNATDTALLRKLVLKAPNVLGSLTLDKLATKIDWLQEHLGVNDERLLLKKITTNGALLRASVEDNLEPTFVWLQQRLCYTDDQAKQLFCQFPMILTRSIDETIEPKMMYLQERFHLDSNGLSLMVRTLPALLSYSVEANIEPTLEFFSHLIGEEAAIDMISKDPRFLSYSLRNRLQPRLAEIEELGLVGQVPLSTFTKYPDSRWKAYLNRKQLADEL